MAVDNIQYTDKEQGQVNANPIEQQFRYLDANEIKSVVNNNATELETAQTNIATNATNIATNVTNIATNTSGIATNVTNIATNSSDIATKANDNEVVKLNDYTPAFSLLVQQSGTGSPEALTVANETILGRKSGGSSEIEDLSITEAKDLLEITGIESDVATNTANIATNVTNISTAQSTADAALPKAGGTMTGAILGDQSARLYRPVDGTTITASVGLDALSPNQFYEVNSSSGAIVITVNDAAAAATDVGVSYDFVFRLGGNSITFAVSGSQTIISKGSKLQLSEQGSGGTLKRAGTGRWYLIGDLKA